MPCVGTLIQFVSACHLLLQSMRHRKNASLDGVPEKVNSPCFHECSGIWTLNSFIKVISLLIVIIDKDIKNVILRRYNSANGTDTYKIDYMGRLSFNEGQLKWNKL